MKMTTTTLSRVATLAVAAMCLSACTGYECSREDHRSAVRTLEADLRAIEGEARTYTATSQEGVLRVELTVVDVVEEYAVIPPAGVRMAQFVSELLISDAHAEDQECLAEEARANVTFTVVWDPADGEPETLHDEVGARASYGQNHERYTSLTVSNDGVYIELVSEGFDAKELKLREFYDRDNSAAEVNPR